MSIHRWWVNASSYWNRSEHSLTVCWVHWLFGRSVSVYATDSWQPPPSDTDQTACLLSAGSLVVWYIKWVHATGNLLLLKQVTACPPGSLVVSCCLGCCVSLEITAIQKLSHCVRWSYVQRYTRPATLFRFSQSLVQTGQCKTIKKSHIWTGKHFQRSYGVKPHIYWW